MGKPNIKRRVEVPAGSVTVDVGLQRQKRPKGVTKPNGTQGAKDLRSSLLTPSWLWIRWCVNTFYCERVKRRD